METGHEPKIETIRVEQANASDLSPIYRLLENNKLPVDDLSNHIGSTLVARGEDGPASGSVVGSATLEMYGPYALLRSVAVDEKLRGQGVGQELTRAALDQAHARGVRSVYLLTETASGFFPIFGFRHISREEVPAELLRSVEFTTACPDSALVMRLDLGEVLRHRSPMVARVARVSTPADVARIAHIYNQ